MRDEAAARVRHRAMRLELLHRADAAAAEAGHLVVARFWLSQAVLCQRADRMSDATERRALSAHSGF